jgi:hypothetical protein
MDDTRHEGYSAESIKVLEGLDPPKIRRDEYVWSQASEEPFPILTEFMIAWTAEHGTRSERLRILRAIEKRRGKTIRQHYERRLLPWDWDPRYGLEMD